MINTLNAEADIAPVFGEFRQCKHNEKTQTVKGKNAKVMPYDMQSSELFNPLYETNIGINIFMDDVATRLCISFLKELRYPKKISAQHLSSQYGILSCRNSIKEKIMNFFMKK